MPDSDNQYYVTMGWKVDEEFEPVYWLKADASPGGQRREDVVQIPVENAGAHFLIVGQSGSGKSQLLGCLIEEIALNSKAEFLVLDVNGDFLKIDIVNQNLWKDPRYNRDTQDGLLPHEPDSSAFSKKWANISKRVRSQRRNLRDYPYYSLLDLPAEVLSGNLRPRERTEVFLLHEAVWVIEDFMAKKAEKGHHRGIDREIRFMKRVFEASDIAPVFESESDELDEVQQSLVRSHHIRDLRERLTYISMETREYYIAKVLEMRRKREFIELASHHRTAEQTRIEVIDVASVEHSDSRLRLVGSLLHSKWKSVRREWSQVFDKAEDEDQRVPVFIVLDEAHNLVPRIPADESADEVRRLFRTVAAEGRKFGLFLILASQRPDKLDPFVVSECQNIALLKLNSNDILDEVTKLLPPGNYPPGELRKCLGFKRGRAFLLGDWTDHGLRPLYSAARRTVEGGRNLRKSHWARPY